MKEINIEPIAFEKVKEYTDDNTFVITGLQLEDTQEDAQELAENLRECGLCADKEIIGIRYISGNLLGERGRHDYLVEYKSDKPLNPLMRLRFAECVKWTSDFIENYRRDYELTA